MNKELARQLFSYSDGHLVWLSRPNDLPWTSRYAGKMAGGKPKGRGYVYVRYSGKFHAVHRVIWAWHNGEIPAGTEIDHANRNPLDNRIENLRTATRSQNARNRESRSNKTGCRGVVTYPGSSKFYVRIAAGGVRHAVGSFDTLEQAELAYRNASRALHGEFSIQSQAEAGGRVNG